MEEMKQRLAEYQPIFILGSNGSERYEFFRGIVEEAYQSFFPRGEFVTSIPYPIILFPDNYQGGFIEHEETFFPLSSFLGNRAIECLFIPIKNYKLPSGFIYILLPSMGVADIENRLSFHENQSHRKVYKIIWMESFPYGQRDGLKVLESLKRSMKYSHIDRSVCLLQSGRRFGFSDMSTEEKAVTLAEETYLSDGLSQSVFVIGQEEKERQFAEVIYTRSSYKQIVLTSVKGEIAASYEDFKNYFDEDYEYLVIEKLSIEKLDEVFSFRLVKKIHNQNPIDFWINQIDQEIISPWRDLFTGMINEYLQRIDIIDRTPEIELFLHNEWKAKMKKLKKQYKKVKVNLTMDELTYLARTKQTKLALKQDIMKFLFEEVATSIKTLIETRFDQWKKVL